MEKKTKQLVAGDMVKNVLNGKFYPLVSVTRWNADYVVKLDGNEDGCEYIAEHSTRHEVQA